MYIIRNLKKERFGKFIHSYNNIKSSANSKEAIPIMSLSRTMRRCNKWHLCLLGAFLCVTFVVYNHMDSPDSPGNDKNHPLRFSNDYKVPENNHMADNRQLNNYQYNDNNGNDLVSYKKDTPLIWIGGVPRSGTTLMRAMLDAHPEVRCGEETRVIPRILGMHSGMTKSQLEMTRLKEAKIDENVLNNALAAYILSIISLHGEPAPRLCNKDPFTLRSMSRILKMFPQSKFILMVRDGRATAHSIISRKVTIKGFDIKTYKGAIKDWNRAMTSMWTECQNAGPSFCLPVYYEQLVLHPEAEMRKILQFLDIPWNDLVIHHEKTIGQTGGVSLSKKELSTDQVDKPVNLAALTKWADFIPNDVKGQMREIAPMLQKLGYDPDGYPPNYGTPDEIVVKNSQKVQAEKDKLLAQGIDVDKLEQEKAEKRHEEEKRMIREQSPIRLGGARNQNDNNVDS